MPIFSLNHFIDVICIPYLILKIHIKHFFGMGLSMGYLHHSRTIFNTKMVLDQFKIKYPPTHTQIISDNIWAASAVSVFNKVSFLRVYSNGGRKGKKQKLALMHSSTSHKWSFHEDTADKERRKDKKHSWLRNGTAAPPQCLIQLLRMAFLWLRLLWIISLSLPPTPNPPHPRLHIKDKMQLPGLQRFPSSLLWWNKIPCYAGKLPSPFFTWAMLSHGQDEGSQAWTLTASPEICHVVF